MLYLVKLLFSAHMHLNAIRYVLGWKAEQEVYQILKIMDVSLQIVV